MCINYSVQFSKFKYVVITIQKSKFKIQIQNSIEALLKHYSKFKFKIQKSIIQKSMGQFHKSNCFMHKYNRCS